jgi:hypothetical protein
MVGIDPVTRRLIAVPQPRDEADVLGRLRSLINKDHVDRTKSRRTKRKVTKSR